METTEPQEPTTLEQHAESLLLPETADDIEQQDIPEAGEPDEDVVEASEGNEEAPEADEATEADEIEGEQEADEQPQMFTVTVDGAQKEVTLDELTRGYAGQEYIQKGMTDAAQKRKEAEATQAEVQNQQAALNQERQNLQALIQGIQQDGLTAPVEPSLQMATDDPLGFIEAKARYDHDKGIYDQKMAQINHQQAQASALTEQQEAARLEAEKAKLHQAIPAFADPEKAPALASKMRETAANFGFSEAEVGGITDARMLQVLHDAMLYRQNMAQSEKVTEKVAKARPVVKPKGAKVQDQSTIKREEQRKAFRKSGRIEDAAALILEN